MKRQRHKHKDSFSILFISHMGKSSRQLHVTTFAFRLLLFALFLFCSAVIWLILQVPFAARQKQALNARICEQENKIEQLRAEKEALEQEKHTLEREKEFLQLAGRTGEEQEASGFAQPLQEGLSSEEGQYTQDEAGRQDPSFPGLSPSSQMGMLVSLYSQEQPYLSINTHREDHLIAAGDGVITAVGSDDIWPLIIEVEHENGYQTRYMCRQMAELQVEEAKRVKAGDILAVITSDDTQLDYQVILEGEPIDPLNVIDAKG